jgi:hypothetical protein
MGAHASGRAEEPDLDGGPEDDAEAHRVDAVGEGPARDGLGKALADTRSVDLGGFALRDGDDSPRGSGFLDLLLMRANGQLMQ